MTQAVRGLVLGHVPCVHDGVVAVVAYAATVDLSGAAGAVAVRGAGWAEAGTTFALALISTLTYLGIAVRR